METLNLVLKVKTDGNGPGHLKGVARISVGRGGLMLYSSGGDGTERIEVDQLQSLSWVPVETPIECVGQLWLN